MPKNLRILNLGAGVQSTALYAMILDGELPPVDAAIFADVGDEPESVYEHLEFLKALKGPEIITVSRGNLGDNLRKGVNSDGQRFVAIPSFLKRPNGLVGMGRRQCTSEYKILPIRVQIREMLGLKPRQRMKKDDSVTQIFGLSFDEPKRVARVRDQFRKQKGWDAEFPLFDDFITRTDCLNYLQKRFPGYKVPRSACVYCPYRSDEEWSQLKEQDADGWARAVEIDNAIRDKASACVRGMNSEQFLHRSCKPLELVELKPQVGDGQQKMNFSTMDCEGMCGL